VDIGGLRLSLTTLNKPMRAVLGLGVVALAMEYAGLRRRDPGLRPHAFFEALTASLPPGRHGLDGVGGRRSYLLPAAPGTATLVYLVGFKLLQHWSYQTRSL